MPVPVFHVPSFDELLEFNILNLDIRVLCGLYDLPGVSVCLSQRARSRAAGGDNTHHRPHLFSLLLVFCEAGLNHRTLELPKYIGLSDSGSYHLLCAPQVCVCEKNRFSLTCFRLGLRELTDDKLSHPFASVGVRRGSSSVNINSPCPGSLHLITSKSAGESDCGAHEFVVGIRTRLHVYSDVWDKLAM